MGIASLRCSDGRIIEERAAQAVTNSEQKGVDDVKRGFVDDVVDGEEGE